MKPAHMAFCSKCWAPLPDRVKKVLWDSFDGQRGEMYTLTANPKYRVTVEKAIEWLQKRKRK